VVCAKGHAVLILVDGGAPGIQEHCLRPGARLRRAVHDHQAAVLADNVEQFELSRLRDEDEARHGLAHLRG
jgi:hypothetical protein